MHFLDLSYFFRKEPGPDLPVQLFFVLILSYNPAIILILHSSLFNFHIFSAFSPCHLNHSSFVPASRCHSFALSAEAPSVTINQQPWQPPNVTSLSLCG